MLIRLHCLLSLQERICFRAGPKSLEIWSFASDTPRNNSLQEGGPVFYN